MPFQLFPDFSVNDVEFPKLSTPLWLRPGTRVALTWSPIAIDDVYGTVVDSYVTGLETRRPTLYIRVELDVPPGQLVGSLGCRTDHLMPEYEHRLLEATKGIT